MYIRTAHTHTTPRRSLTCWALAPSQETRKTPEKQRENTCGHRWLMKIQTDTLIIPTKRVCRKLKIIYEGTHLQLYCMYVAATSRARSECVWPGAQRSSAKTRPMAHLRCCSHVDFTQKKQYKKKFKLYWARLAGSMKLFRKSASTPATPATKVRRSRGDGSRQGEREGGSLRRRGRREGEERGRGWRREGGREGWRREGAEFLGR